MNPVAPTKPNSDVNFLNFRQTGLPKFTPIKKGLPPAAPPTIKILPYKFISANTGK